MPRIKVKFRGLVEKDGHRNRLKIVNEKYYHYLIKKFEEGEVVWITIENQKSQRSLSQNNLYWLYLTAISEHTGHTTEELHEYCKNEFLPKRSMTISGGQYLIAGSTSKLSKGEFVEYVMRVQAFAGGLGIELPDPKDLEISPLTNE